MLAEIEKRSTGYTLRCCGVKLNFRHLINAMKYCRMMHFVVLRRENALQQAAN
jgi:hypothetical protein